MSYDFVIVGAGSAGAVLAARLTEDPDRTVLLVEAGPDYPDHETMPDEIKLGYGTGHMMLASIAHNWDYPARGSALAPDIRVPAGKVTGGTSAINGQLFIRGLPEDYDGWASEGNDLWHYSDLLPCFIKSERDLDFGAADYHGTEGPIPVYRDGPERWMQTSRAFHAACLDAGYKEFVDANAPDSSGVGACPYNNPGKIRISTAMGYLDPARDRGNLTILPNALVHRVVFNDNRATGVEVEYDGRLERIEGQEIILSSGAMGSPQVLLRSGIGPADQLTAAGIPLVHHLPGVGQNLIDHVGIAVVFRVNPRFRPGPDDPYGQVFLRYTSDNARAETDMFLRLVCKEDELHFFSGVYAPLSSGELTVRSPDAHVDADIDFRYLSDDFDLTRMCAAVRLSLRLAQHPMFQDILLERLTPDNEDLASDEALQAWVARWIASGKHVTSSCKMGPADDPRAVVDQCGRVHGVVGLRVVDASIMPRPTRGNTNATTIAIGERIAELIATAGLRTP